MNLRYIWYKVLKKIKGSAITGSLIHSTSKVEANSIIIDSSFSRYSFCGYDCKIINAEIGAYCSLADGVVIGVAAHPFDWVSTSPVFYAGRDSVKQKFSEFKRDATPRTIIGNDVWIGEKAIIKAGVKIGTGAIVGMGAVVTHNVEPYEIVGGVPAKHIRYRFDKDTISKLLQSNWWDLSDDAVRKVAIYIRDPKIFCEALGK